MESSAAFVVGMDAVEDVPSSFSGGSGSIRSPPRACGATTRGTEGKLAGLKLVS